MEPEKDNPKIFVGGLGPSTTEDSLRAYFDQFGAVVSVDLPVDTSSSTFTVAASSHSRPDQCRKFAIVQLAESSTTETVLSTGHYIDGFPVGVRAAFQDPPIMDSGPPPDDTGKATGFTSRWEESRRDEPRRHSPRGGEQSGVQPPYQPDKIHVSRLPPGTTKEQLYEYFRKYGPVKEVAIPVGPGGVNKRYGFVVFESPSSLEDCLLDYKYHTINTKWVEVVRSVSAKKTNEPKRGRSHQKALSSAGGHPVRIIRPRRRSASRSPVRRSPRPSPRYRRSPSPRSQRRYSRGRSVERKRYRTPSPRARDPRDLHDYSRERPRFYSPRSYREHPQEDYRLPPRHREVDMVPVYYDPYVDSRPMPPRAEEYRGTAYPPYRERGEPRGYGRGGAYVVREPRLPLPELHRPEPRHEARHEELPSEQRADAQAPPPWRRPAYVDYHCPSYSFQERPYEGPQPRQDLAPRQEAFRNTSGVYYPPALP